MPVIFFIIFLFILILLAGLHFFLYRSIVRFCIVRNKTIKIIMAGCFAFFTIGFLGASIFLRFFENGFTTTLYIIFATWTGVFTNLLLVAVFAWIIFGASKLLRRRINLKKITSSLLLLSIIFSTYGIVNATEPQIKKIDVKIAGLPDTWNGRRAVHLSDLHLGAINNGGFTERVTKIVQEINPDIIFITGDLFDGTSEELEKLAILINHLAPNPNFIEEAIKESPKTISTGFHPPLGAYFVAGNHETYIGIDKIYTALEKTNIQVLNNEIINVDGVQIVGLSYPAQTEIKKDFSPILSQLNPASSSILLFHAPSYIDQFKQAGINLQLSGHTHRGQLWPFGLITRLIFGKYHYGLHTEGDYNINTSAGTGTWGPPIRTSGHSEIVEINFFSKN